MFRFIKRVTLLALGATVAVAAVACAGMDKAPRTVLVAGATGSGKSVCINEVDMSDWKLNVPAAPATFMVPDSAKNALPIPFNRPDAAPPAAKP